MYPKDEGLLSVDRESVSTAAQSFARFVEQYQGDSAGSFGVRVDEALGLGLKAFASPVGPPKPNPAHACLDYRQHLDAKGHLDKNGRAKAAVLARAATDRRRLFPKDEATSA